MKYGVITILNRNKALCRLIGLLLLCTVPFYSVGSDLPSKVESTVKKECAINKVPIDIATFDDNAGLKRRLKTQSPIDEWLKVPVISLLVGEVATYAPGDSVKTSHSFPFLHTRYTSVPDRHIVLCVFRI